MAERGKTLLPSARLLLAKPAANFMLQIAGSKHCSAAFLAVRAEYEPPASGIFTCDTSLTLLCTLR